MTIPMPQCPIGGMNAANAVTPMSDRPIDNAPALPLDRVCAALDGEFNADALSDAEWQLFDTRLPEAMSHVRTPAERAFWASFAGQANTDL